MDDTETLRPIVRLLRELRPDVHEVILESLLVEALDDVADRLLDHAWAAQRAARYPHLIGASTRPAFLSYAKRRAREAEAAKPQPTDYPGGKVAWNPSTTRSPS